MPEPPPEAPFAHRPYLLGPRSAARVQAGAAAERSEGSLDMGEHRGLLKGRWQTVSTHKFGRRPTFLNVVHFGMNVQQAVEAPTVTSSAFAASMYPGRIRGMLTMPAELGERVADGLASKGHRIEELPAQQPYMQTPSGAGAVKDGSH